jgi:hypothetical protein
LCPYTDSQQYCRFWLEDYFKNNADYSPTVEEEHVRIDMKNRLYKLYAQELSKKKIPHLDEREFMENWRVLFPLHRTSTWCNIPGKCWVCYEIDRARQTSSDSMVQQKCGEAHYLHRAGMFGQERAK